MSSSYYSQKQRSLWVLAISSKKERETKYSMCVILFSSVLEVILLCATYSILVSYMGIMKTNNNLIKLKGTY